MTTFADIASTFAVAVIGGVVAPRVTQAKDRRSARAAAAQELGSFELARWWPDSYEHYRERHIAFRSAAIGAGLPKRVLDEYVRLSRVARLASYRAGEEAKAKGENPWGGRIDPLLYDLVAEAADIVFECLWHPALGLLRYRGQLRHLEKERLATVARLSDDPHVLWDVVYGSAEARSARARSGHASSEEGPDGDGRARDLGNQSSNTSDTERL